VEAVKGVPIDLKLSQKGVDDANAVSDKSVSRIRNKLDVIESGASTSFATRQKVRARNLRRHHVTILMKL
jgi:hypothetical protein